MRLCFLVISEATPIKPYYHDYADVSLKDDTNELLNQTEKKARGTSTLQKEPRATEENRIRKVALPRQEHTHVVVQ